MNTKVLVAVLAILLGGALLAIAAAPGAVGSRLAWYDLVVSGLAVAVFGGACGWQALRDRHGR